MPKTKIIFRTAYGEKLKVQLTTNDSRTEQSHKEECDINNILKQHNRTGQLDHVRSNEGIYDDFTEYDYQNSMNIIATANSMFEELPSQMRNKFENDPSKFLNFVHNEKNNEEMYEMGIKIRPKPIINEKNESVSKPASVASESASVNASQSAAQA